MVDLSKCWKLYSYPAKTLLESTKETDEGTMGIKVISKGLPKCVTCGLPLHRMKDTDVHQCKSCVEEDVLIHTLQSALYILEQLEYRPDDGEGMEGFFKCSLCDNGQEDQHDESCKWQECYTDLNALVSKRRQRRDSQQSLRREVSSE